MSYIEYKLVKALVLIVIVFLAGLFGLLSNRPQERGKRDTRKPGAGH
jgi:hypothetical protein